MKTAIGFGLAGLLLSGCIVANTASAQTQTAVTETPKTSTSTKRFSGGRDPFRRYEATRVVIKKKSTDQVKAPTIQERIESYKAQKLAAMNARMPAPKPTTALLLNEIQVVGISRTPRGYAAIIEATPIKLTYVIYPGEPFYDGQLVAIEDTRLVFRHETIFSDGRRERSVQVKNLRPANPVNSMSTTAAPVAATNPN
jgi:hypothetical protein